MKSTAELKQQNPKPEEPQLLKNLASILSGNRLPTTQKNPTQFQSVKSPQQLQQARKNRRKSAHKRKNPTKPNLSKQLNISKSMCSLLLQWSKRKHSKCKKSTKWSLRTASLKMKIKNTFLVTRTSTLKARTSANSKCRTECQHFPVMKTSWLYKLRKSKIWYLSRIRP